MLSSTILNVTTLCTYHVSATLCCATILSAMPQPPVSYRRSTLELHSITGPPALSQLVTAVLKWKVDLNVCLFMQIHEWVTAMSLTNKPLKSWVGQPRHPFSPVRMRSSKRLKALPSSTTDLSISTVAEEHRPPKKTHDFSDCSGEEGEERAASPLDADAMSLPTGRCWHLVDRWLIAAAEFAVDDVSGVLAFGSTGAVYRARYNAGFAACKACYVKA